MSDTFANRIAAYTARIDARLDETLPEESTLPTRLHEAMRYAVLNGGKRVRPLLVYATGECLGVSADALDAPAVAIELIHAFSLVHDDLPAMDDDDLRRGEPTAHIKFDEATAILAADALQPLAFGVLAGIDDVSSDRKVRLVQLIAEASGSNGMTGGQSIDLAAEGSTLSDEALEQMYSLKTGALIHACVVSASLLRGDLDPADAASLDAFGRTIGIAFQIKDDLLDVEGETHIIGKPAGADQRLRKATYPGLFGLEKSRQRCDELLRESLAHLECFGDAAAPLELLARFIVERGR
ncbi:MAG: polyprenyl synthetase family protein [Woeseiaceae bacterium]